MTIHIPNHVALVMDGNGRWAKQRGLPRTAGHEAGEAALFDVVEGAIEFGVNELEEAEELTSKNKTLTLNMCVNYGGRAEIVDAAAELARDVKRGKVKVDSITDKVFANYLDSPKMNDVDLFLRSSGEQRTSNFLPWQSVYAELVFMDVLWPDVTRKTLWKAIEEYSQRDRRFGKA